MKRRYKCSGGVPSDQIQSLISLPWHLASRLKPINHPETANTPVSLAPLDQDRPIDRELVVGHVALGRSNVTRFTLDAALNKTCDWEQRWKFDDSTRSTQEKFSNVNTIGNAVWDPLASRTTHSYGFKTPRHDSLPSFADLTTDEDRERKAEANAPGTYNVIVNPESFSRMPEYARSDESRRPSVQSTHGPLGSQELETGRLFVSGDPNTIVLTRFEDPATHVAGLLSPGESTDRRPSLHGDMGRLEISGEGADARRLSSSAQSVQRHTDEQLFRHYEDFISPRLVPMSQHIYDTRISDPIVEEARNFAPLHHAICAISLLNLYYLGKARWEDALEREAMATRVLALSIRSDEDLNSNGVFLMHYLLLIYDICNPVNEDHVWLQHSQQLKRIVSNRVHEGQASFGVCWQVFSHALWLETQASLAGREIGSSAMPQELGEMLQPVAAWIRPMPPGTAYHQQETDMLKPIVRFTHHMISLTGQLGQLARQSRSEDSSLVSRQQALAARQQAAGAFQNDIWQAWNQYYPSRLPRNDVTAGRLLSPRCRLLFESGYLFHCITVIYSGACMFPGQFFSNPSLATKVAFKCRQVLALANNVLEETHWCRPPIVFAVFLAGVCTPEAEVKSAAMQYIEKFGTMSISRNASKAKALLAAVIEEQRLRVMRGERAEEVDWISVARERGMEMIDFGL
ncbi:hypothetical protein K461DRAFT_263929 [Myriangium duriaei CBS 260.36]|uniref:Transcription factor domain-containing protein n=1 Tax=Myriangium duriaei CBS 260.36 TaxID=1168546 RepID=A0A9P4J8M7_9PEZI|nr:hypothetical protein K461DRAFT_263929 [Myriangium duriaei CBS 260.36]